MLDLSHRHQRVETLRARVLKLGPLAGIGLDTLEERRQLGSVLSPAVPANNGRRVPVDTQSRSGRPTNGRIAHRARANNCLLAVPNRIRCVQLRLRQESLTSQMQR